MIKAIKRGSYDYMGFAWYEIFKNGITTNTQLNATDAKHAVEMYNNSVNKGYDKK